MAPRRARSVRSPRALFLDLDDTLLDNSLHPEAIVRTCVEIAASHPGLDGALLVEANREVPAGPSAAPPTWRRTLQQCGCSDESVVQRATQTHGRLARAAYRLFDDVHEVLAPMAGAHVPLALITNGAADTQRAKLAALGIEHWFDAVVVSAEIGIAKPDAAIFELALDSLAVEREAVWHVGDSLTTDVAGGRGAGLTAVWLNRTGVPRTRDEPEPDLEIRSLLELIPLLSH